jgi:hypothetical protein
MSFSYADFPFKMLRFIFADVVSCRSGIQFRFNPEALPSQAEKGLGSGYIRHGCMHFQCDQNCLSVIVEPLSAPIHNYGNLLVVIFFPTRALSVEWIRFLISSIRQDFHDYWDFFRLRRNTFRPKALLSK